MQVCYISKFEAKESTMKTIILDSNQIERIIQRIAYQIVESCHSEKTLVIVGVKPRGTWVANQIVKHLSEMNSPRCFYEELSINDDGSVSKFGTKIEGECVILVDDILNSGATMMRAAAYINIANARRIITACLVDRKHRRYPIQSDFTGLSLATTIRESLALIIEPNPTIILE